MIAALDLVILGVSEYYLLGRDHEFSLLVEDVEIGGHDLDVTRKENFFCKKRMVSTTAARLTYHFSRAAC